MTDHARPPRRRLITAFATLGAIALGGLAGCAVLDGPQTVVLTAQELTALLEKRFPLDRRMLEVLDVTVSTPRLRLLPERNRLASSFEVATRDRLFGNAWRARMALDAELRLEPSDHSVRLSQVRVQELSFDGAETLGRRDQAERLGALLAERVLEDFAIYRMPPDRVARLQRLGVVPGTVSVTSRGVEITVVAAPR